MLLQKYFFLTKIFLQFNILILLLSIVLGLIYLYFIKYFFFYINYRFFWNFNFIKYFSFMTLIFAFFSFLVSFYFYIFYINVMSLNIPTLWPQSICFIKVTLFNLFQNKCLTLYLTIDLFGYVLYFLAYLIGFISLLIVDNRLNINKLNYFFIFNLFLIIIFFYTTVSSLILFFFAYECLLVPSFFFVYFLSPNRKAIQASIYFLIWTQIGSIIVLGCIVFILVNSKMYYFFFLPFYNFSKIEIHIILWGLFLGFGFKIPIWPFHYWLTKTHVEAPSGFSIFLSGFLVKTALFGFYKFFSLVNFSDNSNLFILICVLGVIDASVKMWGQVDLKKLIAYGTIQEMNLIYLLFCFGNSFGIVLGIFFTIVHGFLSGWMFFMVDCLYRRFATRSIVEISGLFNFLPQFCCFVILMILFFTGLPGTIKFLVEFGLFSGIFDFSILLNLIILFNSNVLGLIGFSKNWFNLIFGLPIYSKIRIIPLLSQREVLIILLCLEILFGLNFFIIIFF